MPAIDPEPSAISVLIEAGADPNARAKDGSTPLHWAAGKGSREKSRPLKLPDVPVLIRAFKGLEYGSYVTFDVGVEGQLDRILLRGIKRPEPSVIAALIEAGADPGVRDENGWTPLHWTAVEKPELSVIAALIKASADPGFRDENCSTPLHWAQDIASSLL